VASRRRDLVRVLYERGRLEHAMSRARRSPASSRACWARWAGGGLRDLGSRCSVSSLSATVVRVAAAVAGVAAGRGARGGRRLAPALRDRAAAYMIAGAWFGPFLA
jgi:hypothetical protein